MLLRLMAAILFSTSVCAWAGTIFKCKNPAGVILYQEKPCEKEVQTVSSWASTSTSASAVEVDADSNAENAVLVIGQGDGGHYYIDGAVNDSYLNFVIDTGATTVALPLATAQERRSAMQKDDDDEYRKRRDIRAVRRQSRNSNSGISRCIMWMRWSCPTWASRCSA